MSSVVKKPFSRLPTLVTPVNYDIRLTPNLKDFTFEGAQKIRVKINQPTSSVTLNAVEIKIVEQSDVTRLTYADQDKNVSITKVDYDTDAETVVLQFGEELKPGEAYLQLAFNGILNDKLKGFYRSKYTGPDGVERNSATTQFEPADARRAFPCWDEPSHKATFDITLVVANDGKTTALSNMPVVSDTVEGERRVVKFDRTPIMSTYLVAFVIGEFDFIEGKTNGGIQVRVYAPVGKVEQGRFALDACVRALDFYHQYFGIPYPLKKMDLIAISDFACGAMENWGLVTYRETCLLVDPANTSTVRKQYVALVVAHELAHQWFGNLVTMEWWTHLWLNEGFATFIEFLCVDHLFPHFNIWNQFVSDVFLEAMDLDALDNSHPIEVPVGPPSEVDEIFDDISYSKGASVIRMLYKYLGDEAFRKGMNLYLTRHSYKNTQTEDLWDALEESSQKPIRHMMSTWTQQKGYPVISVTAQGGESLSVEMRQQKFSANGKLSEADSQMKWAVPISIITTSNRDKPVQILLENTQTKVQLELGPEEWFKLNPSSVGTYRVNYSPDLLKRLFPGVIAQTIPPTDRLNLVYDLYALVVAGQQSSVELMRFMDTFRGERDYTVWSALSMIMSKFNQVLASTDYLERFHAFGRTLVSDKAFPWLGWTEEPDEKYEYTLLRSLLLQRLVNFNDPAAIEGCQQLFAKHVSGEVPVVADLRSAVYRAAMKTNSEQTYETLLKLYRSTDLHEEKNRILCAIASVRDPKLIQQLMEFTIGEEVRSQDSVIVLASLAANVNAREAVWEFFKSKIDFFQSRYTGGFMVNRLVKAVSENFSSEEKAREVEEFFAAHPYPGTERSLQQAVETIRLNAQLLKRDAEALKQFFASK